MTYQERREKWTPEYRAYHDQVVAACVELMGENNKDFFEQQCDYFEGFNEGISPADNAQNQYEAMT